MSSTDEYGNPISHTTGATNGSTGAYDSTTGRGLGGTHGTGHHDAQHGGVAGKLGDAIGMTGTGTGHHDEHRGGMTGTGTHGTGVGTGHHDAQHGGVAGKLGDAIGMTGTGTGHHDEHRGGMTGTGHHVDQPRGVTGKLGETFGITGGKTGHHDQHHQGHGGGVTGGVLNRSGSSSSSSSEDDGQGGRRKKGLKEKIKEKLPGQKKTNEQTATPGYGGTTGTTPGTGTAAGYGGTTTTTGQHPEKKGVMEKIKEKMPGQH